MLVELVPTHMTAKVWPKVERYIADVEPYVHGEWTVDQIKADVLANRLALIAVSDGKEFSGAVIVAFQNRRNSRTAFIMALAGSGLTTDENYEQLKRIFTKEGCTEVEAAMRNSTLRLWQRLGFERKYHIAGMKL